MKLFRRLKNEKLEHDEKNDEKTELTRVSLEELILSAEKEIAFLCIGSDRAIADSLGPLVGTMLKENNLPYPVYGTLKAPVHALNLEATLEEIRHGLSDHLLIVLDACIGQEEEVGTVFLKNGPLHPGLAIGNSLPPVGDFHLIAVVNYQDKNGFENYLTDTRLFTIYDMAKKTSELILAVAWSIKEKQKNAN
jgi:putative sporulation protein YyaC